MRTINIDGSQGEGGGQILRSSLALSLLTGSPFRIEQIRAGRKKPGLLRQHLTALQAAVEVSEGVADGAVIGSSEVVFRPGKVAGGEYRFAIGTAGSATLVLQTLLPALALAARPSRLVLEGGTHNPFAPPFDFLERTFLPILQRCGPKISAFLAKPGFYPAGGGKIEVEITPAVQFQPLRLHERGARTGQRVIAHLGALPAGIGERAFAQILKRQQWDPSECEVRNYQGGVGPGFALTIDLIFESITEVFVGFGERGLRSEQVADRVVDSVRQYLKSSAPVGDYLADQLLLPMALAGAGSFIATRVSRHARTNMEVIEKFLPVRFQVERRETGELIEVVR